MFTEQSPRDRSSLVKVFRGIAADQFWKLIQHMTDQIAADALPNGMRRSPTCGLGESVA